MAMLAFLAWTGLGGAGEAGEIVWQWFEGCVSAQQMHVDVQLNGRALYSNSFPACTMRREDVPVESPQKLLEFFFRGHAGLFGAEFDRLGTVDIEGNIWRAGGEADALLLGISFATPDRVLLNSVHIATARSAARSTMAKGLVVHTSAVRPNRARAVGSGGNEPQNNEMRRTKPAQAMELRR
jgi:hypothetical protein